LDMRTFVFAALALAAVAAVASATASIVPEFCPCSFHGEFHTRVLNQDRQVIATSRDHIYFDNEQYWRWDSDFSGVPGVIEAHQWIITWRPDMGCTFHDYGDKCLKNDDRPEPPPAPYEWLLRNTNGISWFRLTGTWEDMPVYIYHATFTINNRFSANVTTDVYVLQDDLSLVLVNGTVKSSKLLLDLTYHMDTVAYEHNVQIQPNFFIPSAICANGTIFSAPPEPSEDFKNSCYESAGSVALASWVALLLLLVAVMLV